MSMLNPETATALGMGLGGMIGGYFSSRRGARHGSVSLNGAASDLRSFSKEMQSLVLKVAKIETRLEGCPIYERRLVPRIRDEGQEGCR